ncbi:hypothetical protein B0T10DRAFT_465823 [Thelonectria olida]|uniref:Uncharacterized protein n=1 Tax=Thelonectria olida TaxID=1576542 RepID=A0A9P8VT55_9HYPO|nr:hypothetical protein B0T10DRAFT_465823 [Thelonectria olida]
MGTRGSADTKTAARVRPRSRNPPQSSRGMIPIRRKLRGSPETRSAGTRTLENCPQATRLQSSAKVLVDMANGIFHSVAYHLGHRWCDGDIGGARKLEFSGGVPTPGGFLLLWPLFFSGMLRTTPKEQRQWVAKTIRQMGVQMGLQLAMSMAKLLEEKPLSFSHNDTFFLGEWHPN